MEVSKPTRSVVSTESVMLFRASQLNDKSSMFSNRSEDSHVEVVPIFSDLRTHKTAVGSPRTGPLSVPHCTVTVYN
jgi:hypothetical protein